MSGRSAALDALRVLAALAVVAFHATGALLLPPKLANPTWWMVLATNAMTRWCVPVFVMITGALLLTRSPEAPLGFYRRRWGTLLPPLAFWSVFFLLWRVWPLDSGDVPVMLQAVSTGRPYYHLWYLYMLLGLHLSVPLLQRFLHGASERRLQVLLAIAFAYVLLDPMGFANEEADSAYRLIPDYVFYLLLGCYLWRHPPARAPWWHLGIAVGSVALMLLTVAWGYPHYGVQIGRVVLSFFDPLVMLMSAAIFVLFLHHGEAIGRRAWIAALSRLSLGVYLIHPITLGAFLFVGLGGADALPLLIPASFLSAALLAGVLQRLPVLRAVV